jgi:hypothetical protein
MLYIPNNLKICTYNSDVIVLDILSDEFSIIENCLPDSEKKTENQTIFDILSENFNVKEIHKLNIIPSDGYFEIRWMMPFYKRKKINIVKKIFFYLKARKIIKNVERHGFIGVEKSLYSLRKKRKLNPVMPDTMTTDIINTLISHSMRFFQCENPCLIYSYMMVQMLIKCGFDAKIVVGVRTKPFYSHAWVEIAGGVIGDDSELRKKLSVIMEI